MAVEAERLLAVFEAKFTNLEKALDRASGKAQREFQKVEDAGTKAERALGNLGSKGAGDVQKFERATKGATVQTGNLAAQINDIGVQLAGGQSPFLIAIQQGTQIQQALGSAGAGAAVKALGGAFASLVNPVGLATIATIGLGGAAIQYFSEWAGSGAQSTKEIEKQAALIQRVADRFGDAVPALREYADQLKRAADERERLEAKQVLVDRAFEGPRGSIPDFASQFASVIGDLRGAGFDTAEITKMQGAFSDLTAGIADGSATTADLEAVQKKLNAAYAETPVQSVRDLLDTLEGFAPVLNRASTETQEINKQMGTVTLTMGEAKDMAALITAQLVGMGPKGTDTVKMIAEAITGQLVPSFDTALDKISSFLKNFDSLQKMVEQTRLDRLDPLVSGGGSFLDPAQLQNFRAQDANRAAILASPTAEMIRREERFRADAYHDVNAYRTGYGSDTITRANGSVEKVTKESVVTLQEAELDLARRIVEFQDGIRGLIGGERFNSFSDAQKAALTSVAYNYGSIGKGGANIADVVRSGSTSEIANAIAGLSANPERRKREAQAFGGGGFYESPRTVRAKKSPDEIFAGGKAQVQARIDLMNAEYEVQSRLNPLVKDYGFELEKARIEQQLLSEAKKAGLTVTPELSASISELATNYAKASSASSKLRESQQNVQQSAQEFNALGRDVLGGFISDLRNGKSAADALQGALGRIADRLIDMSLDSLFGGGKAGTGGAIGGTIHHLFRSA